MNQFSTAQPTWKYGDYSLHSDAVERLKAAWKQWPGPNPAEFLPTTAHDHRPVRMLVHLVGVDDQWRYAGAHYPSPTRFDARVVGHRTVGGNTNWKDGESFVLQCSTTAYIQGFHQA